MKRIITGLIVGSVWLLLLLSGSFYPFWLLVVLAGGLAFDEYCRIILNGADLKYRPWFVPLGSFPVLAAGAGSLDVVTAALFLSLFGLIIFVLATYRNLSQAFDLMARIAFGILIVGFTGAHLVLLRSLSHGVEWLLVLTAIIVASDSGAYYIGCWLGETKLCPAISPGKTWAGALGGLSSGVLAGLAAGSYLLPSVGVFRLGGLAFVLVAVGIIGDLAESVIKRDTGVKDSGTLLAGHGGLLDRIDSILLAAPVLFYIIYFELLTAV